MNKSINDTIKYLIIAGIIYSILKMIPAQPMQDKDLLLIVAIIVITFISMEQYLFKKTENFETPLITPPIQNKELTCPELKTECNKSVTESTVDAAKCKELLPKCAVKEDGDPIAMKYMNSLIDDLYQKNILDTTDIMNIKTKVSSKLLNPEEIIISLENLKINSVAKNKEKIQDDGQYNELPTDFIKPIGNNLNKWDNEFTLLNTNKWQVPMPKPPVCVNTTPCKVCPNDSPYFPVNLKNWDDSRVVSDVKINKSWAENHS
jgi:hypothetical protein